MRPLTHGSLRTFGQESHAAEAQVGNADITPGQIDAARAYIDRCAAQHGLSADECARIYEQLGVAA